MLIVPQPDVTDLFDGGVFEPGKLIERQEILLLFEKYPEAVLGDVGNLRL